MKKLLFIYNPHAGKKELIGHAKLHTIIDYFTANGFLVTAYATQGAKDAYEQTKELGDQFDYIVCAGGDGTLNEITQGVLDTECTEKPIIGYIPTGSTNDFSAGHNIPTKLKDALEVIVNGRPTPMDVGIFNGYECFNYVAAFGLFTDVTYDTSQTLKNIFGHSAYVLEGVKRLANIKPIKCEIKTKDSLIEEEILLCIITNSASVGGFDIPANMRSKEGGFHVILLKYSSNIIDYQGTAAVLMGLREPTSQFLIFPLEDITLTSEEPIAWTLDGEYGGAFKNNIISVKKDIVKIMLPRE